MYQLVQNFNTLAELQAFVAAIGAAPNASTPAAGKGVKGVATSPSPSTAASSPAAAPPPPAVKEKTYEQTPIGAMLKEAVTAGKKDAAIGLLKKFEATKDGKPSGQGLKADQFDAFEAELKAILATEDNIA